MNYEAGEKKEVKNNIPAMKQKLAEMQSTKLNWVENLISSTGRRRLPQSWLTRRSCTARSAQTEPSRPGVNWRKMLFTMTSKERCFSTDKLKQLCWKDCRGCRV